MTFPSKPSDRRGPRLRILVTNWNDRQSPYAGGADVHLHQVFGRLVQRGHEVTLLAAGWPGAEPAARLDGIDIRRIGGRHTFTIAARRYFDCHLRSHTFDVVVEDLNKVPLLAYRWSRRPFVLLVHHLWGRTAMRAANPLVGGLTWASEIALLRAYRGLPVQSVSDSTAHDLVRRGIRPADIRVITNGVELPNADTAPAARPDPRPTLVALGRLQPYKRVGLLLQIVARVRQRVPDVRLLVIGSGPDGDALRSQAAALGLESSVEFLGFVSDEVKQDALARAWLHVTASEREGWGLTVLEAAVYGVPTVAGDVPGLRESVAHERSGVLVPPDDTTAFADTVVQLLENEPRRAELGAGARRLARYYSWDRAAMATEEHLQEVAVLGRSRRGWEPLRRAFGGGTGGALLPRDGTPPLPFGRRSYVVVAAAGPCDPAVPVQVTFGAEDATGHRPGILVQGLPAGAELALEAFASAVIPLPNEHGLFLQLPGWPEHPERWLWEEFGAALRHLRPRAVYRL